MEISRNDLYKATWYIFNGIIVYKLENDNQLCCHYWGRHTIMCKFPKEPLKEKLVKIEVNEGIIDMLISEDRETRVMIYRIILKKYKLTR